MSRIKTNIRLKVVWAWIELFSRLDKKYLRNIQSSAEITRNCTRVCFEISNINLWVHPSYQLVSWVFWKIRAPERRHKVTLMGCITFPWSKRTLQGVGPNDKLPYPTTIKSPQQKGCFISRSFSSFFSFDIFAIPLTCPSTLSQSSVGPCPSYSFMLSSISRNSSINTSHSQR